MHGATPGEQQQSTHSTMSFAHNMNMLHMDDANSTDAHMTALGFANAQSIRQGGEEPPTLFKGKGLF